MCVLRELYGSGAEKLQVNHMTFTVCTCDPKALCSMHAPCIALQTPSKKKLEINSISSNYHIEINPRYTRVDSSVGVNDDCESAMQEFTTMW